MQGDVSPCVFEHFLKDIIAGSRNYLVESWVEFPLWAESEQNLTFTIGGATAILNFTSMDISPDGELLFRQVFFFFLFFTLEPRVE